MKTKTAIICLGLAGSFVMVPYAAKEAGLRINTTDSAPFGIWITKAHQGIHRGSLVSVCPPDVPVVRALVAARPLYRGDCHTGSVDVLKPVSAVPGDLVIIGTGNVTINGTELPNTKAHDAIGYSKGKYVVGKGEVWVFSTYSGDSFDSRYYGPVPMKNIRGLTAPLLVNGDTANMTKRVKHD